VNAVLVVMVMLESLHQGQLPPPQAPTEVQQPAPLPALPPLPPPEAQELVPASQQLVAQPPALMPAYPDPRGDTPIITNNQGVRPTAKPPAFKLVEMPVGASSSSGTVVQSPTPTPTPSPPVAAEPVPTGSSTTPCLVLQRLAPGAAKAGQPFSYELIVRNVGSMPAAAARLEEVLPRGSRYAGGQPLAVYQGERLVWDLQPIAPGAERRVRVDVEPAQGGAWKSEATLTVAVSQSQEILVSAAPPPMLTVSAPAGVTVGYPVNFAIRVTNSGTAPLANVVLGVRLSPGLQHLQGDAIEGPLGELGPGKSRDVLLETVTTEAGRLTLDATVLSNGKALAAVQRVVTATEAPALMLKLASALSATNEQEFKLDVINRSASELRDIAVTEILPEGLDFVAADAGSYDPATRTLRWSVGTLASAQIRQVTFRAALRSPDPQLHRFSARAGQGTEAVLHTIVRGAK
jgi:uncharacterized repeat protein (TIGR01451 family)